MLGPATPFPWCFRLPLVLGRARAGRLPQFLGSRRLLPLLLRLLRFVRNSWPRPRSLLALWMRLLRRSRRLWFLFVPGSQRRLCAPLPFPLRRPLGLLRCSTLPRLWLRRLHVLRFLRSCWLRPRILLPVLHSPLFLCSLRLLTLGRRRACLLFLPGATMHLRFP
jgi:hypothetical protein